MRKKGFLEVIVAPFVLLSLFYLTDMIIDL